MKKQKKLFYYLKYKKTIFIFLFLLNLIHPSLQAILPSLATESILQSPYIYQSVNVISGDYCEAETDFISPLDAKINIRRCFSNDEGWVFNLPLVQNRDMDDLNAPFIYQYDEKARLKTISTGDLIPVLQASYSLLNSEGMTITGSGSTFDYEFRRPDSRQGILPFTLKSVSREGIELCRYTYCSHPFLRKQLLVSKENSHGYCQINEYYDKKYNEVGDQLVIIEDPVRDFRIGRVKLQKIIPGNGEPEVITAKYFYYPDHTEVFDALDRKTIYRYESNRLTATEAYIDNTLYRSERLIWKKISEEGPSMLVAKVWQDGEGRVAKCITYAYDSNGNQVEETLYGILSGINTISPIIDEEGKVLDNGVEFYRKRRSYSTEPPFLLLSEVEDNGKTITYDPQIKQNSAELTETDANIQAPSIHYSYDNFGRVIQEMDEQGNGIERAYDVHGNPTKELFFESHHLIEQSFYCYDPAGKIISIRKIDRNETTASKKFDYNKASEKIAETDQYGNTASYHYDEVGRLIAISFPSLCDGQTLATANLTLRYDYDILNNIITIVDPQENKTTIRYNAYGKPLEKVYPNGIKESYFYYLDGSLKETVSQISLNNNTLRVDKKQYDCCNRLVASIEAADTPYSRTTYYHYNSVGQLETVIKPSGVAITHQYSALGLLENYYASDLSFKYRFFYDEQGLLIKVQDEVSGRSTERSFNAFGQVVDETLGNGLQIKRDYDALGRKLRLTLPDNSYVSYHYDSVYLRTIERFSKTDQLQYSHSYSSYNLQGQLLEASLIGNAGILSFEYEQEKCISISSPCWTETISGYSKEVPLNITNTTGNDVHGDWQSFYSYDNGKLIEERGIFEQDYDYDESNNRVTADQTAYEYDLLNQLHSQKTCQEDQLTSYRYDLNGNLIEKNSGSEKISYRYDALDRLTAVEFENSLLIEYVYDAFYRRLSKTVSRWDENSLQWGSSEKYAFLYDGDREIGMMDSQGKFLELRILGLPIAIENKTEIGSAIAHEINGECFVPIHDHRGNVCCLIDPESGAAVESYRYSAFGSCLAYSSCGELLEESALNNPWLFSSKRRDPETGLIYYGKRYYDPDVGRWISKDPLGENCGTSPYHFLSNNPLNQVDLYGLFSIPTGWKEAKEMAFSFFDVMNQFKKNASYESSIQMGWNQVAGQFFDKGFLQFAGFYSDPIDSGASHYGEEKHDKVRITLINGILNVRYDLDLMVKLFSVSHGDTKIHYVYRPTEGWTKDMFSSIAAKFGFSSPQAKLLAKKWKDLIQEMGGVGEGGKIIHYAHSIGAADSYIAKNLLTWEEQRMIHVISIGSPTMIPNDSGFASVINYVSKRDGVCLLDPIGYLMGYFYGNSKIEWVGSLWGIPLIDHTLSTDSYGGVIKELGAKFIKAHWGSY